MSSPRGAAVARAAAALCAGLALFAYATVLLLGSRVGWVVVTGGGEFIPAEPYDVRGELAWFALLTVTVLIGTWLAGKLPRHPVPWLLIAVGLGFLAYPVVVLVVAVATADGEVAGWVPYVAWLGNWVWIVAQVGAIYLLLLFPDGRALNRRWRAVARGIGGYLALVFLTLALFPGMDVSPALENPFGLTLVGRAGPVLLPVIFGGFLVAHVLAVAGLVVRFVRSVGVERQQMKWMALGAVALLLNIPAGMLGAPRWIQTIPTAILLGAIVVAITRYRLVVAASTLAVVALFQPVRRRVQSVTDRRFNRSRYDAEATVGRFAERLRDEVGLAEVRADLRDVVTTCVQPSSVSVWIPRGDASG